ncbi:MAG TPA: polysaccharide deacetylase family protein, partial [Armatimonadota bacterium]|nr:polysaccharide deacetylase family protein [Armatimonadota bacterium]
VPGGQVVITFDDGYRDNRQYAAELLRHYRLPAAFFLTAGWIGTQHRFWWDEVEARIRHSAPSTAGALPPGALARSVWDACSKLRALPAPARRRQMARLGPEPPAAASADLPMSWDEARELARMGFSVGAHTVTHPALSGLEEAEARREIQGSRELLEEALGLPVRHFCYPYDEAIRWGRKVPAGCRRLVEEAGYETAVTVVKNGVTSRANRLAIPRLAVQDWDVDQLRRALAG